MNFIQPIHRQAKPFLLLPWLLASCGESDLENQAREMIEQQKDSNSTTTIQANEEVVTQSPDGLQFTKEKSGTGIRESVGISKEGQLTYKGDFKDGKPEGLWTTFFPSGRPRWQGVKKDGLNHGSFDMWYEDGSKRMSGTYERGKKHGKSTAWHPNGVKWLEQWHHQGVPVRLWKHWNDQGELIDETQHPDHESNATQKPKGE